MTLQTAKNCKLLSISDIEKIHEQLGDATATQMNKFIRKAQQWDFLYFNLIHHIVTTCYCTLAVPPLPRLVCATSPNPKIN